MFVYQAQKNTRISPVKRKNKTNLRMEGKTQEQTKCKMWKVKEPDELNSDHAKDLEMAEKAQKLHFKCPHFYIHRIKYINGQIHI